MLGAEADVRRTSACSDARQSRGTARMVRRSYAPMALSQALWAPPEGAGEPAPRLGAPGLLLATSRTRAGGSARPPGIRPQFRTQSPWRSEGARQCDRGYRGAELASRRRALDCLVGPGWHRGWAGQPPCPRIRFRARCLSWAAARPARPSPRSAGDLAFRRYRPRASRPRRRDRRARTSRWDSSAE